MFLRNARVGLLLLPVAAIMLAVAATTPAYAHSGPPVPTADPGAAAGRIAAITDDLARGLARSFSDRSAERRVVAAVTAGAADLASVEPSTAYAHRVRTANAKVLAAKGLPAASGSVLQVRLAEAGMSAALASGVAPLVAATPTDDAVTDITAYAIDGGVTVLDASAAPARPVLLVEVNTDKAQKLGLAVMRNTLAARGVSSGAKAAPTSGDAKSAPTSGGAKPAATSGGYWATKIDAVRLSDDEEPWFKGAAEIYSIVGGFDLDGVAKVDIVDMPYLDYDGTTYYPNQLLVQYNAYKYNLADVVMMEDDGDTNYQSLAEAIADALLTIADQGQYIPLVTPILNAIPSSWWTDDPDYVDSWYTLSTTTSGHLAGAAANGWMDVEPYWVAEL